MHYKNGREAHNGDKVILISPYSKSAAVGILYDAVAGNDYCNGKLALISPNDPMPSLAECLHLDDALALITGSAKDDKEFPDTPDGDLAYRADRAVLPTPGEKTDGNLINEPGPQGDAPEGFDRGPDGNLIPANLPGDEDPRKTSGFPSGTSGDIAS